MFDIGFPELIVVSIVALLVIGPDKLPETLRSLFLWVGRLRRSLANIGDRTGQATRNITEPFPMGRATAAQPCQHPY